MTWQTMYVQNGDKFDDLGEYGHLNRNHTRGFWNFLPQKEPWSIAVRMLALPGGCPIDQIHDEAETRDAHD